MATTAAPARMVTGSLTENSLVWGSRPPMAHLRQWWQSGQNRRAAIQVRVHSGMWERRSPATASR